MKNATKFSLGDLPMSKGEQDGTGKKIHQPGKGESIEVNRNISVNVPFKLDTANKSVQILPANPMRKYVLVQNKSDVPIYLVFGAEATEFGGVRIIAGGNYEINGGDTQFCPQNSVFVVAPVLSATVTNGVAVEGTVQPERGF